MDWTALSTPVVIAAVPIIVSFVKQWLPAWLIVPVAAVLGGLGEVLASIVANRPLDPTVLAVAGVAGVGLRELVDQFKKAVPA